MKVAVLGCGTIGRGVVDILLNGVKGMKLAKILDKKEKFVPELIEYYTDNVDDIMLDESIDTVVETMGGRGFSYTCVRRALELGKNVVTANKELIAYHLKELSDLADEKGVYLLYEASVGGGIPFIKTLSNLSQINRSKSIIGILNGTTNYILTKMQKDGLSYEEALKGAQKLGFAEANPTADVEGHDMVRKIAIISMLAFKQEISVDDIYTFGITKVSKKFIDIVNNNGYTLKFVCFTNRTSCGIELGVEPVLFKNDAVFANINYETNFVKFDMDPNDALTFIGKGAGRLPTATAIVSDLTVIRDKGQKMFFNNIKKRHVGFEDKIVDAYVEKDGVVKLLQGVKSGEIRGGSYDFYAMIYKD